MIFALSLALISIEPELSLHREPKKGDKAEYLVEYEGLLDKTKISYSARVLEVVKVVEAASAEFSTTTRDVEIRVDEEKAPPQPESTESLWIGSDGTIITAGKKVESYRERQAYLMGFLPPEKGVGIGGSWQRTQVLQGGISLKGTYKLLGSEIVKGVPTLKVEFSLQEVGAKLCATAEGRVWLAPQSFVILRMESKVTNFPFDLGTDVSGAGKLTLTLQNFTPGN